MFKPKSLTIRSAEAVKKGGPSSELKVLRNEVNARMDEVDAAVSAIALQVDGAQRDGDLDALLAIRQTERELKDEYSVLFRQRSDLNQGIKTALGREIMSSAPQLKKQLYAAAQQARKAQDIIAECLLTATALVKARMDVAEVGEELLFDADTIMSLAMIIYPDGNERKQLMINLGANESRRAQRARQAA